MKNRNHYLTGLTIASLFLTSQAFATNPIIMDQFTADPTARVFEGQIYLYPSHDMKEARAARGGQGWFAMEDYHAFSSSNLMDWTDHGIICDQTNVPWLNGRKGYDMWAPDCVFKGGTYYFYFPVGGRIGVATSSEPYGPWKVLDQPVTGASGIDPCVLQDDDGTAYLFTGGGGISVAKLKDNMIALDTPPPATNTVANVNNPPGRGGAEVNGAIPGANTNNLPGRGGRGGRGGFGGFGGGFGGRGSMHRIAELPNPNRTTIEGPFAFKRNGIYYLTYPHAVTVDGRQGAEELEYAISTNVFGPYKWMGIITDTNKSGCWTEHHSIVQYKGQWYLFYADKQLSPDFDKNRSVRVDYLHFNDDGTIQKVIPTLRGVGIADAKSKIQIDRYSDISPEGVTNTFINPADTFEGWKISLNGKNSWVKYDRVDFGKGGLKSVNVRSQSETGGTVEIRADKVDGPVLAKVDIGRSTDWQVVKAAVTKAPTGVHDLVVTHDGDNNVDIDWVRFE